MSVIDSGLCLVVGFVISNVEQSGLVTSNITCRALCVNLHGVCVGLLVYT